MIATTHSPFISVFRMYLIHYSFMPLILFRVHTHSICLICLRTIYRLQMGLGYMGYIRRHFELNVLYKSNRVNNKVIYIRTIHINVLLYWNFVCSVMQRVSFMHKFICRKPTVACKWSGTNKLIWECCISYSTLIGVVLSPSKPQAGT